MFKRSLLITILIFLITNVYASKSLAVEEIKVPDSFELLPPPPAFDSISFLNDKSNSEAALNVSRDSSRYKQAVIDTGYSTDDLAQNFSTSFGHEISKQDTPMIYNLMNLAIGTSSEATHNTKKEYKRIRPFVYYNKKSCNPAQEKHIGKYASYPSGHTTEGWAVALMLAEINPDRQQQILQKGYEFGQSRIICGAHWSSDVQAGYLVGSTVFSALNANDEFRELIIQARKEITSK
ncbi:phosphatase PAP2 family protein [Francisellaceae bacterium CB52]